MNALARYLPILIFVAIWQLYVMSGFAPGVLPSPVQVVHALGRMLSSTNVGVHIYASLSNLLIGLLLSIVVGVAAGVSMARFAVVDALVNPLLKALYPIPKSALIPILIMWLGLGNPTKIAAVFIGCLLPIVLSSYNGARGIDKVLVWSAAAAGASKKDITFDVVIPGAMPEILAGIRNALGLSFVLLVSSEFIIAHNGLGYLISFLGDGGNYDGMFAAVLLITVVGFAADRLYVAMMRRALSWK